jgi:hypothetical protein
MSPLIETQVVLQQTKIWPRVLTGRETKHVYAIEGQWQITALLAVYFKTTPL